MRSAGFVPPGAKERAGDTLKFDERPPTPEHVKQWRTVQEPGAMALHPGMRGVRQPEGYRYGSTTADSDHVADVFAHGPQKPLAEYETMRAEEIYRSHQREPLGKSYKRGHAMPAGVDDPSFAHGVKSKIDESAKELIFPRDVPKDKAVEEQYKKSHGNFGAGEQRRRDYNWGAAGIDPASHRFGVVPKRTGRSEVAMALKPDLDEDAKAARRKIVPKTVDDYRGVNTDQLGRIKNLGRGIPTNLPERFGHAPGSKDSWDAGDCLRGDYAVADQMPDTDLGRSTRPGFRNITKDPDRVFGVPSIRYDIPKRERESVAEAQNYGGEPGAGALVNPSRFAYLGVVDKDFTAAESAVTIRRVFEKAGKTFTDEEFEALWKHAATAYDINANGEVSVEEFRLAVNELEDTREETGRDPAWFHAA
jgi:hypothetical protein